MNSLDVVMVFPRVLYLKVFTHQPAYIGLGFLFCLGYSIRNTEKPTRITDVQNKLTQDAQASGADARVVGHRGYLRTKEPTLGSEESTAV